MSTAQQLKKKKLNKSLQINEKCTRTSLIQIHENFNHLIIIIKNDLLNRIIPKMEMTKQTISNLLKLLLFFNSKQ